MKKLLRLKERSIISISIGIFLILLIIINLFGALVGELTKPVDVSNSYDHLIRFHVIANSDSDEDQRLKNLVRDKLIEELEPKLRYSESIDQSRQIILDNINKIQEITREEITKAGKDYSVKASLSRSIFPAKAYGAIVLPGGDYQALKVEIGSASGQNWWCVMFPPLCFIDISHGVIDEKTQKELLSMLTPEERKALASDGEKPVSFQVRFKILDLFRKYRDS